MLYIFTGNVRNGKTISMVCIAKEFYEAGYTIYSNTHLLFPYIPLTRKMILEWEKVNLNLPSKSIMLISEFHAWFDSRNSANSNNKVMSYFLTQLGKFSDDKSKGLTILGDTQFFSQIDIRGRRITFKICECIKVREVENEYIDVMRIWKKNDNLVMKTIKKELVRFDKNDFALYDTQQSIKSETN